MAKRLVFLAAILFFLSFTAADASLFSPPLRHQWRSFGTPHFRFYFYRETEELARRLAPLAERIHDRLVAELEMEPRQTTHVLIYDNVDIYNGFATVLPRNTIALYATTEEAGGEGRGGDALVGIFAHEYTHVLQMGYVPPAGTGLVSIVDDLIPPNVGLPPWATEGLAVAMESRLSPAGRLHSSTWRMYLRTDLLAGTDLTWPQVSNGLYRWPFQNSWYIYGSFFTQFLIDQYGLDKVAGLYRDTATNLPYLSFDEAFVKAFGLSLAEAVKNWRQAQLAIFQAEAERVTATGLRSGTPVASFGGRSGGGGFAPDGSLYFLRRTLSSPAELEISTPPYTGAKAIARLPASRLAVSPDGRTVAYGLRTEKGEDYYSDLYLYDLKKGRSTRLSSGMRANAPAWSPDGHCLAFIHNAPPNHSLYLINLDDKAVTPIWEAAGDEQAFSPSWSPLGDCLAFVRYSPDGGMRLWLIRPDGTGLLPLHNGESLGDEIDPAWSPDGRYLFFAADPAGVFNIYVFDLEKSELRQVTNVLTGAYEPAVSPEGRSLAYTGYSSAGYDQFILALSPEAWPLLGGGNAPGREGYLIAPKATEAAPDQPYQPFATLTPEIESVRLDTGEGSTSAGITIHDSDVLETISYRLSADWDENGLFAYGAEFDWRLAPFSLGLVGGRETFYPLGPEPWYDDYLGLKIVGSISALEGLLSLDWGLTLYKETISTATLGVAGSYRGMSLALGGGRATLYQGPVDLVTGWLWSNRAGTELHLETDATTRWDEAGLRVYLPLFDRARLELAAGYGWNSAGEARVDLGVPYEPGPAGFSVWDAEAFLEFPLWNPEKGGITTPLYLHTINGVAAVHLGRALDPAGDLAWSYALGLDWRLQLGYTLPVDLYVLAIKVAGEDGINWNLWLQYDL